MQAGIITIHNIHNYGSVLQAYALQRACEDLGFQVEIIDYKFPNAYQQRNRYQIENDTQPSEPKWIKMLFCLSLIRQHKGIDDFVRNNLHLSSASYSSSDELSSTPPSYDIYITGSDQVWSPRHTNGDPTFMLHFAPDDRPKIAYAASIGSDLIPEELQERYSTLLSRYQHISVRESSGCKIIQNLTGKEVQTVLDPTLLLGSNEWNKIATNRRLVKGKYILCYFLNYSFNAFPYVDELAEDMQRQTGYKLVRVARPPHKLTLCNTSHWIEASPEEFLALVRDAEMVLTTSFHGTAFAVNYGRPLITVVQDRQAHDSRQQSLMNILGLESQVLPNGSPFPSVSDAVYDVPKAQGILEKLRKTSKDYLKRALGYEQD